LLCAALPLTCTSEPNATLTNFGTWPTSPGCANKPVGDTCTASCPGTGTAEVTCERISGEPLAQWSTTVTGGGCNTVYCAGPPNATVNFGTWNTSCAGAVPATESCTASCPGGGSASVQCLSSGQWSDTVNGACEPACLGEPDAALLNRLGTWNGSCSGKADGETCAANCTYSGSATVECLPSGSWNTTIEGSCNPAACTGTPPINPSHGGTWPNCAGTLVGQNCTATCVDGGPATLLCEANNKWAEALTTDCALITCSGQPDPSILIGSNAGWDPCDGKLAGQFCSAPCEDPSTSTSTVECLSTTGNWSTTLTTNCTV
jgi:hypothetical protein